MDGLAAALSPRAFHRRRVSPAPIIADLAAAKTLFAPIGDEPREIAVIAYLDADRRLLGTRHMIGQRDRIAVPIRLIARDALAFDARGIIIAHNHPSGDVEPSDGDIAFTRQVSRAMRMVDITLFDHLILARDRTTSMRGRDLV